jgi:hypothetical protein
VASDGDRGSRFRVPSSVISMRPRWRAFAAASAAPDGGRRRSPSLRGGGLLARRPLERDPARRRRVGLRALLPRPRDSRRRRRSSIGSAASPCGRVSPTSSSPVERATAGSRSRTSRRSLASTRPCLKRSPRRCSRTRTTLPEITPLGREHAAHVASDASIASLDGRLERAAAVGRANNRAAVSEQSAPRRGPALGGGPARGSGARQADQQAPSMNS